MAGARYTLQYSGTFYNGQKAPGRHGSGIQLGYYILVFWILHSLPNNLNISCTSFPLNYAAIRQVAYVTVYDSRSTHEIDARWTDMLENSVLY